MITRERQLTGVQFFTSDKPTNLRAVLEIDEDALFKALAPKANRNHSKKTQLAQGSIRMRVYLAP